TRVDPNLLNDFNAATNENGDDVPPTRGGDLPVPDLQTMEEMATEGNGDPPVPDLRTMEELSRVDPTLLNDFEMATDGNGDPPILHLRTIEELCQPTLNGRGGPTAPIAIQATNFRLKNDMIQQSIKVNGVTDDALHLYLFPYSLTHHATAWFDRLLRNSINTFEQMAKMFLEKYFPPSMVTKLRNEITNFRQRPDESLFEAWERYKLSIDRCPNHNMLPVTHIDTFYNGLTLRHRDTINAATSNALHNAIMEAGGKDRPPMLSPSNYVKWKSRIKRYIDTKPNHELIHYCLWNLPYGYKWNDKVVLVTKGVLKQQLKDDKMSKDKEIDKLMALISLSFKKIYKPTNNNLRTSSNTNRANQDNSLRISRGTRCDNQRIVNVAGARETLGTTVVQKSRIQCYNYKEYGHVARECQKLKRAKDAAYHKEKMLLCKQEEAGFQLNA
nr:reverse transcriptase domain-containing protein [Tanacetum cinerariifolium]